MSNNVHNFCCILLFAYIFSNNTNSLHEDPLLSNWTIQTPVVEDEVLLVENEKFYYPGEEIHFEVTSKDEYGKDAVSFIKVRQDWFFTSKLMINYEDVR